MVPSFSKRSAPSSFNRRRGTTAGSGKNGNRTLLLFLLGGILVLVAAVGCLVAVLASAKVPASSPLSSNKAGIPGVPNLLRGPQSNNKIVIPHKELKEHERSLADQAVQQFKKQAAAAQSKQDARIVPNVAEVDNNNNNPDAAAAAGNGDYPYPLVEVEDDYDPSTYEILGGGRFAEYAAGTAPYEITAGLRTRSDAVARSRKVHIRRTLQFVWAGYVKYAFGMDELLPQSGKGSNGWGGQGITLVDSLDTLWLAGLKDEFWAGRDWVRDHLDHSKVGAVSMFETTIRDLGGLLSAYDWSGDQAFLTKATDLGERLLHGFDGSSTGIPFGQVSLKDHKAMNTGWTGGNAILAEFGTIQIEFRYLAKATGRPELAEKAERVFKIMNDVSPPNGLYPYYYRNNGGDIPKASNQKITFGAMADSFYEYMLKVWLQGGKTEPLYRDMYDKAMDGLHDELLQRSNPSGLAYLADKNSGHLDHKMDHLVCFMGGLLALGAYTDPLGLDNPRAIRDLTTARALTYTCYQMYARMNTGISAEFVQFASGQDFQIGRGAPHYLLRPEAVESMFILNQLTGDPVYREWGWEIYQSIERHCKTKYGYGALSNVQQVGAKPRDKMESFFIAETLKYLYLLQDPDTPVDVLHTHVFNTEAHPLRIFPVFDKAKAAQTD